MRVKRRRRVQFPWLPSAESVEEEEGSASLVTI
jgi:hypothetical protein